MLPLALRPGDPPGALRAAPRRRRGGAARAARGAPSGASARSGKDAASSSAAPSRQGVRLPYSELGGVDGTYHTVRAGDTLIGLASYYGVFAEELLRANPQLCGGGSAGRAAGLRPGQRLLVTAPSVHAARGAGRGAAGGAAAGAEEALAHVRAGGRGAASAAATRSASVAAAPPVAAAGAQARCGRSGTWLRCVHTRERCRSSQVLRMTLFPVFVRVAPSSLAPFPAAPRPVCRRS
jgi:hypothetical protein